MTDPTLCQRELREDRVLHVRLDRPEARNAFNDQLIAELRATFDEASADEACRAVLLTGNGKSFSAGADIDWMRQQGELSYIENLASAEEMAGMFQAIYACRKPVVVAAHGAALGGGTGLVAAADIALCEHSTVLGFTEVRLGILPAVISPYVVEKIGIARARALFVLGSRFDGREAERIGLVFRSVPDGGLEAAYEEPPRRASRRPGPRRPARPRPWPSSCPRGRRTPTCGRPPSASPRSAAATRPARACRPSSRSAGRAGAPEPRARPPTGARLLNRGRGADNTSPMQPPFRRVLVANRGEIACRVIRGVQESGGEAVAVFSDVDARALHVRRADRAVALGGSAPAESYLAIDKLLAAARDQGCEAVHPGYGFLSENAAFARAVEDAGMVFIGPTAEAMQALGSKQAAKQVAEAAGVPCVPGFDGRDADEARFAAEAARVGFPLLVKASAGGGGRGMRLVTRAADFPAALEAGRREAEQAFGDGTMLLERYLVPCRHVEVQVFGDGEGGAAALGERECSIQRRHQKVLEEAPSPVVGDALRAALEEAACALVREIRYRNAGTVEFLVDGEGRFYFLEVNTRLQVEHPVTELVTGLDLVQAQLAIAAGDSLAQALPSALRRPRGWALEARICAEDPVNGFLPAAGLLSLCAPPEGPGVRVDTGFGTGDEVPVHYDSLLAKLIVYGPDRASCLRRMEHALVHSAWLGLPTNVDFVLSVLRHPAFQAGDLRTDFLEAWPELTPAPAGTPPDEVLAAAALAPVFAGGPAPTATSAASEVADPWSPWRAIDGFRPSAQGGAR
ncbi:MAG: biotin carboxylase N-terminal domain-containing protein [Planctomycetota bacterium]